MATSSPFAYRAGDVIVVPFPYSGRLEQKRRPALVVSAPELHTLGLIWAVSPARKMLRNPTIS
ncbi:MAG TPA: type II toxin-antitoxin system PemK/MazF family toxin [Roseiarcus sp.]|jgi:mRNA interferase MazF